MELEVKESLSIDVHESFSMRDVEQGRCSTPFTIIKGIRNRRGLIIFSSVVFCCAMITVVLRYPPSSASPCMRRALQSDPFQGYNCIDDRLNHNQKMYANTFLCSTSNAYIFGMDENGDLIWGDLSTGEKKVYFKNEDNATSNYFMLTIHGKFKIFGDNDETLWVKKSKYDNIGYHECLEKYACPYLHLHGGSVCVMNWIDADTGEWMAKNINRAFGFED